MAFRFFQFPVRIYWHLDPIPRHMNWNKGFMSQHLPQLQAVPSGVYQFCLISLLKCWLWLRNWFHYTNGLQLTVWKKHAPENHLLCYIGQAKCLWGKDQCSSSHFSRWLSTASQSLVLEKKVILALAEMVRKTLSKTVAVEQKDGAQPWV